MILDERALFSDKQDLSGGSAASTSSYDLGTPGTTYDGVNLRRNIGSAGMIALLVQVTTAFTVGGGFTSLDVALETDEDVAFGSVKVVMSVNALLADLVVGFHIPGFAQIPRKLTERYVRFNYTANGAAPGAGALTAGIVAAVDGAYQGNT